MQRASRTQGPDFLFSIFDFQFSPKPVVGDQQLAAIFGGGKFHFSPIIFRD